MCTKLQLDTIVSKISECAEQTFGDRLRSTILYGSYARGDYDNESDIDIIVLVDIPRTELFMYKKPFLMLSSELGLEYDLVITVNIKDTETFDKYHDVLPYYQNITREGVLVGS